MIELINAIETLKKTRANYINIAKQHSNLSADYSRGFEDALGIAITLLNFQAEEYNAEYEAEQGYEPIFK